MQHKLKLSCYGSGWCGSNVKSPPTQVDWSFSMIILTYKYKCMVLAFQVPVHTSQIFVNAARLNQRVWQIIARTHTAADTTTTFLRVIAIYETQCMGGPFFPHFRFRCMLFLGSFLSRTNGDRTYLCRYSYTQRTPHSSPWATRPTKYWYITKQK